MALLGQNSSLQVIALRVAQGTTQALPSATQTVVRYDTTNWDSAGMWNGTSFCAIVPVAGFYNAIASIEYPSETAAAEVRFLVGSSLFSANYIRQTSAQSAFGGALLQLKAGDQVAIAGFQGSGATAVLNVNGAVYNWFALNRLSGPAQAQASEIITARYSTDSGQAVNNNSLTIVNFEDKSYDDHGCVTTGASWKFNCPRAGRVSVTSSIQIAALSGWAAGEGLIIYLYKNGVEQSEFYFVQTTTHSQAVAVTMTDEVNVVAGDYLDVRVAQDSGDNRALNTNGTRNWISISYIGGLG